MSFGFILIEQRPQSNQLSRARNGQSTSGFHQARSILHF